MLAKTQQKYWKLGDKPHRLLARQLLHHTQASHAIHKIRDKQGTIITDPSQINSSFAAFYENLYQSKVKTTDAQKINNFLESSSILTLDDTAAKAMDAEITLEELQTAVSEFPNNKVPGSDGFTNKLYKRYLPSLAPLLLRMFAHSKEVSELPPSLYNTNIALILKKGWDSLEMSSYRPISLLQMETKILSKVLVNTL